MVLILAKMCCCVDDEKNSFFLIYINMNFLCYNGTNSCMYRKSEETMADQIQNKDVYSDEEKKIILERLNAERKARQKEEEQKSAAQADVTDKEMILQKIDEERRISQKYKELQKRRLKDKKVYHIENRVLHKFLEMDRSYYIQVKDCELLSSRPMILPLFYRVLDGLKKKEVLMQVRDYSDKIFISDDVIRVYFKQYALEDNSEEK